MSGTKCFKVVSVRRGGRLTSLLVRGEAQVEYRVGKRARAKAGGLMCFSEEHQALEFSYHYGGVVYSAIGYGPRKLPRLIRSLIPWPQTDQNRLTVSFVKKAFNGVDLPKYDRPWPYGTLCFREVVLKEDP